MNRTNKNNKEALKNASLKSKLPELVNIDVESLTPEQLDDLLKKVATELEANADYDSIEASSSNSPTLPPWVHFT